MKEPSLSIIIPFYNNSSTIRETLESVKNQLVSPNEVIIVNDGSSKEESEFLVSIVKNTSFKIIYQENQGPSTARNNGVNQCKSDYVVFLDSDDLISNNGIEVLKEEILKNEDIDVLIPKSVLFGVESQVKNTYIPSLHQILKANNLTICVCAKSSLFNEGYRFKEELNRLGLEDWEWWIQLISNNKSMKLIDKELFRIRVSNISRTFLTANKNKKKAISIILGFHASTYHREFSFLFLENKGMKKNIYFYIRHKLKKILRYGRK